MQGFWKQFTALMDFAPWQCWRQGHRWLPCLKNPVHR